MDSEANKNCTYSQFTELLSKYVSAEKGWTFLPVFSRKPSWFQNTPGKEEWGFCEGNWQPRELWSSATECRRNYIILVVWICVQEGWEISMSESLCSDPECVCVCVCISPDNMFPHAQLKWELTKNHRAAHIIWINSFSAHHSRIWSLVLHPHSLNREDAVMKDLGSWHCKRKKQI